VATDGATTPDADLPAIALGEIEYAPQHDGEADPGEVVWAWVPYEEDPHRGKDRPVLVLGRSGSNLVGLMLSSQDHDRDARDEARYGRFWMDIGTGAWDGRRRPSEVRLDRVLRLPHHGVRREGAALPEAVFRQVVAALKELHGRGPRHPGPPAVTGRRGPSARRRRPGRSASPG
jgi:hypothetical protein